MVVLEIQVDGLENVFAHFGAGEELGGGGREVEAELDGAGGKVAAEIVVAQQ